MQIFPKLFGRIIFIWHPRVPVLVPDGPHIPTDETLSNHFIRHPHVPVLVLDSPHILMGETPSNHSIWHPDVPVFKQDGPRILRNGPPKLNLPIRQCLHNLQNERPTQSSRIGHRTPNNPTRCTSPPSNKQARITQLGSYQDRVKSLA